MEKICRKCTISKSVLEFSKGRQKDGLQVWCKQCVKEYDANWYQENRDAHRETTKRKKRDAKAFFKALKSGGCTCTCGCREKYFACLSWHHLDPTQKELNAADMIRNRWGNKRILEELKKCKLVCHNCHSKIHAHEENHRGMLIHTVEVGSIRV